MGNSCAIETDLSTVLANIATVDTVVDTTGAIVLDIHDTDLPAVKTDTGNIRGTDIGTITDAIIAKEVMGQFKKVHVVCDQAAYVNVLNIVSGKGKLIAVTCKSAVAGAPKLKITIDGIVSNELILTADAETYIFVGVSGADVFTISDSITTIFMNTGFNTSLKVEGQNNGSWTRVTVYYNEI